MKEPKLKLDDIAELMNRRDLGECNLDDRNNKVFNYVEDKLDEFYNEGF
jgi:hypothetical protein